MKIITTIVALLMAAAHINAQENMKENVNFNVWPKGELNTAYAKYFIGNSYLAPLGGENSNVVNVTFEPRCRNNWHIHHKSVQMLICVAGSGWYVEEGKEPVVLRPGVVVAIPAEAKHWHGAAKDSWMQHLTYMTKVEDGASNEWLEPVTDAEYDKLPASQGDYYTRKGLDLKMRELITFCFLAAQGGCEPQLKGHIAGNYHVGNSKELLMAVISANLPFIGYPRTLNALSCIRSVEPGK